MKDHIARGRDNNCSCQLGHGVQQPVLSLIRSIHSYVTSSAFLILHKARMVAPLNWVSKPEVWCLVNYCSIQTLQRMVWFFKRPGRTRSCSALTLLAELWCICAWKFFSENCIWCFPHLQSSACWKECWRWGQTLPYINFILITTLYHCYSYPHILKEDTELQRGKIWQRWQSHRWKSWDSDLCLQCLHSSAYARSPNENCSLWTFPLWDSIYQWLQINNRKLFHWTFLDHT